VGNGLTHLLHLGPIRATLVPPRVLSKYSPDQAFGFNGRGVLIGPPGLSIT
jgi:hypothetical protein